VRVGVNPEFTPLPFIPSREGRGDVKTILKLLKRLYA